MQGAEYEREYDREPDFHAQNIAREAAIPRSTVDSYFSILEDALLGHFLPAYRPNVKVRERAHPKFFWFDAGVARAAAGLLFDPPDRLWLGAALETLVLHELRVYNHTRSRHRRIHCYRTSSGTEIDFVIETRKRRQSTHPPNVVCCWSSPFYERKRREGHDHHESLRAVAQRWVKTLWAMWNAGSTYDEGYHRRRKGHAG